MPTVPSFLAQPTAAFLTYGLGGRTSLMFRGTISGPQHNGMFLSVEQTRSFSEPLERDRHVTSTVQEGSDWICRLEKFLSSQS